MNTDEHRFERRRRTRIFGYLCSSVFIGGSFSCSGYTGPRSVLNADPAVKIPEIHRAVAAKDRSVIPQLVKDLDSDDAAIRFHSIEALERLTGQTLDYDWTIADRHQRRPALERWQAYLAQQAELKR